MDEDEREDITFFDVADTIVNKELIICNPTVLKSISIQKCNLHNLPDLQRFTHLTEMNLESNFLHELPDYLTTFPLESLDISNNIFKGKLDVSHFSILKTLIITQNQIAEIDLSESIEFLMITKTPIKNFIYKGKHLKTFTSDSLDYLEIASPNLFNLISIPQVFKIGDQVRFHLKNLSLSNCPSLLTINFSAFVFLESLSLRACQIDDMEFNEFICKNESFDKSPNFVSLDLSRNYLTKIPNFPKTLTQLNLDYNLISTINDDVNWKKLKHLSFSGNNVDPTVLTFLNHKLSVSRLVNEKISEIDNGIFLGSQHHASDQFLLEKLKIVAILSVCDIEPYYSKKYSYKTISIIDLPETSILQYFDECVEFLMEKKRKRENVLVHCLAGVSRSATICVAYIMNTKSMSRDEAIQYVRTRRPVIQPNSGFMAQLAEYQRILEEKRSSKVCNKKVIKNSKNEKCVLV
ncbi:dual specificity protein phosphatase, putative [Entamoeba invadens IP1]|uniref:protein-tyrosine-phosphatase n=1 Tax=Entamoeba invadens IP1 TaxID=370355 RepID=A0A0A1UBH6_ENTIV|nr:dual specificity protein phosphatase, putative [Entamoeba invadens IP1]ELP92469.1 dual specificity protein phosphatase, putative [Entamoeba invadens IP1]|eukprot:XP_004259240.1 dual specificity protein phosphatase, putative [Entamoeba invadens IP1]